MAARRFWKFSPGQKADLWDEFRDGSYIALGWNRLGDLRNYSDREEIKKTFFDKWPDGVSDQIFEFFEEMGDGDEPNRYGWLEAIQA